MGLREGSSRCILGRGQFIPCIYWPQSRLPWLKKKKKKINFFLKSACREVPVVQWFGHDAFPDGTWVRSLVGELRSRKPHGRVKNKKQHKVDFVHVCAQLYECYHMYRFESLIAIRIRNSPITPQSCHVLLPCGHALPHPWALATTACSYHCSFLSKTTI